MKKILIAAGALFAAGSLFAYNPPSGGQNVLRLSSPFALTGANSTAGGALHEVIPSSVLINPALSAAEQRISFDAGFTFLTDKNKYLDGSGMAFQLGATLPTRWCVPTVLVQGVFASLVDMHLEDSILGTASVSKDITDKVAVGIGVTGGLFWNDADSDWTLYANAGAVYNHGELAFMRDVRVAITVMNLGKMHSSDVAVLGIKGSAADDWPEFVTPRLGVAASFVDTGDFRLGGSVDVAAPGLYKDFVVDLGVALEYSGLKPVTFKFTSAWEFDVQEFRNDRTNIVPGVGLSVKFNLNAAKSKAMESRGWAESELMVGGAWRNLYKDINAFSAGAVFKLGQNDIIPPTITLWGNED